MSDTLHSLQPSLLAAADILIGGVIFAEVSAPMGLIVVAAGVLLLCGVAFETRA